MEKFDPNPLEEKGESESAVSEIDARIRQFRDLMEHALHLFPDYLIFGLKDDGFFTAPASSKFHGAYEGGLFEHSRNVTQVLLTLTKDNGLAWSRPESPYIIGMFHDICIIDQYRHPMTGTFLQHPDKSKWEYNPDALLKGHGDKSVMLLSQYLQLTLEEILCIRYHMGAFTEQSEWDNYKRAVQQFDTVLWTHHADMIAAYILE